ncbi:pentatricopeptide repeat-containing protein At4g02820, mitochondrial-like [Syzygium oleosum]|uniref:pentatricopeptide repeat-containing protein At4g02820, mitochondrial-like n=1 Tax=Syzygium oleosum TaxID=219896 RepID=UPI0011D27DD4|nr:pentatricopeptide repeat-containing protein At4g02820, mitochondrial-like [Syzygium oleosum]
MLLRSLRATLSSAARHRRFSAEAVAESPSAASTSGAAPKRKGGDTLGKRLLSLVYAKRSAVVTIRKWKEEGGAVRKYELNRIVRELRKLTRYKHALEICEWMRLQQDIKLLAGDYAVHLDLIAKVRGLNSAEKFFEDLPSQMRGGHTCNALLHNYAKKQLSSKAEALIEKMSDCGFLKSPLPFNHMLSMYVSSAQLEKVPDVIEKLKRSTSPDIITYNLWLTACKEQNDVATAERVFLELKKAKIPPDWFSYSILTNLYIKNASLEKALSAIKEMEKRTSRKTRVAYSSLLSLYTNMGDKDGVHRIWKKMKSLFPKMNDAEYTCMISSVVKLGDLKEAEKLYTEWELVSKTGDPRVANILLAAHVNNGQMEMAEKFYERVSEKGVAPCYTTWELLTWGYLKEKQMDKALHYLNKAIGTVEKWQYDKKLIAQLFENLQEHGNVEGAEALLVILRNAGHVSTEVYNSLLQTYAKAGVMPLVIAERMKKDGVPMNDETSKLLDETSKMCVTEISCKFS